MKTTIALHFFISLTTLVQQWILIVAAEELVKESVCGSPPAQEDRSMLQASWETCIRLENAGCRNIITLTSFPPQYACLDAEQDDYDESEEEDSNEEIKVVTPLLRKREIDEEIESTTPGEDSAPTGNPDACVSLYVYKDTHCTGKPVRALSFPTWSQKGSPCYHDALMAHFSVKDQYCNLKTGNWHESIFLGTDTCTIHHHWWEFHDNPIDLTFTSDGCIRGIQLKSCRKGACPRDAYAHAEHFQYLVDSVESKR